MRSYRTITATTSAHLELARAPAMPGLSLERVSAEQLAPNEDPVPYGTQLKYARLAAGPPWSSLVSPAMVAAVDRGSA